MSSGRPHLMINQATGKVTASNSFRIFFRYLDTYYHVTDLGDSISFRSYYRPPDSGYHYLLTLIKLGVWDPLTESKRI